MSKVIQITGVKDSLYALKEDGSIWRRTSLDWHEISHPEKVDKKKECSHAWAEAAGTANTAVCIRCGAIRVPLESE